jgi:hypothetical protein
MRKSSGTIAEDLGPVAVRALRAGNIDETDAAEFDGVEGCLTLRVDPLFDPVDIGPVWTDLPSTFRTRSVDSKS